jgi:hypothetical protein
VRSSYIFSLFSLWLALLPAQAGLVHGVESQAQEGVCRSRFAVIHYRCPEQLESFTQKIRPSALTLSINKIFMGSTTPSPEAQAGGYVDQLFQRVQMILEMPKPELKININLYSNQEELSDAFAGITGKATQSPAFYWAQTNTIYLQIERISPGILAHEMVHAVIAQYFIISPPEKIAEILCRYVDKEVSKGNF